MPDARVLTALVLGNLLPLLGIFLWGWQVFDLIVLYWIESGLVGLFTVARMLTARPRSTSRRAGLAQKVAGALFFAAHYGILWLAHGLFVHVLFGGYLSGFPGVAATPVAYLLAPVQLTLARSGVFAWAVAGLLLAHGAAFLMDLLGREGLRRADPDDLVGLAYRWGLLLHLSIAAGGFLVVAVGQVWPALVLFVAVKLGVEVWAYRWELRRVGV